jgi:hypothetical protein
MGWLTFILAVAVSVRILCWGADGASKLHSWTGCKRKYYSMVLGISLIFGSAWGLVLSFIFDWLTLPAGVLLLAGVDLLLLSNKRSPFRGGK